MKINEILQGDALEVLKTLPSESVDFVCTDPPYGYSFMGKDWDKAVPSVEIWQECLRVLKPGAFACVMSAPRSDVQCAMISRLQEAGFRLDFTPIYWTYASGFPKAGNIGKLVDKRLGNPHKSTYKPNDLNQVYGNKLGGGITDTTFKPMSPQAKALDGSYAGFQPKPAVEVIIVAMKPLSEKTFVDQALKNGKGITWLDDCRIPTGENLNGGAYLGGQRSDGDWKNSSGFKNDKLSEFEQPQGRFPANLLVSDDVLNDGVLTKSNTRKPTGKPILDVKVGWNQNSMEDKTIRGIADSGSYSRYFDLDKWASTLPFLIVPKASKSEKNKGLEHLPLKETVGEGKNTFKAGLNFNIDPRSPNGGYEVKHDTKMHNNHPTVKPLKLMSYLITLFTRKNDIVLDPFVGSGTTCLAAKELDRKYIGIEKDAEYVEIADARLEATREPELKLFEEI